MVSGTSLLPALQGLLSPPGEATWQGLNVQNVDINSKRPGVAGGNSRSFTFLPDLDKLTTKLLGVSPLALR